METRKADTDSIQKSIEAQTGNINLHLYILTERRLVMVGRGGKGVALDQYSCSRTALGPILADCVTLVSSSM